MQDIEQLKYPVGTLSFPDAYDPDLIGEQIGVIADFPAKLRAAVESLSPEQLAWVYRPEGWTIRQVVHHCGDSHCNALTRFKLALTEDNPTIRPYHEALWSELPDAHLNELEDSLQLLTGLHSRWAKLLRTMNKEQWNRTLVHPEHGRVFTLFEMAEMYSWHCRHHLAHVYQALEHKGQF